VAGGVAVEGSPGADGDYFSGACYQDPMGTSLHYAEVTHTNVTAGFQPRSVGALVGGNQQAPTSGVFATGTLFGGANATTIFSLNGTVSTVQVTGGTSYAVGDKLGLVITHNGTNYVYTVFKNGTSTGIFWSDTAGLVSPGVWVSPAFGGTFNSSTWYGSQGMTAFGCGDN
jgi:hypothetical protein